MWSRVVALVAGMALCAPPGARADEGLNVGDPAPPLAISKVVKGEKLTALEPGKLYVVEFWATWCGPCRTSIPHLTELQRKFKDKVTVVGVSILEEDQKGVEPFVKEMGDKMEYVVALDLVPEGKEADEGKMAKGWMDAAGEGGIPTAFVVQKDGRIAWIGHPMAMDKPLEKIVAGEWDIQAAASERKEERARQKKMEALYTAVMTAARGKRFDDALATIDKAVAEDPRIEENLATTKFQILLLSGKKAELIGYAAKLVDGQFKENPQGLNFVAWTLIDPDTVENPSPETIKVALKAARMADELTENENGAILDTFALATFLAGDPAKAAELQAKAVKLLGDEADEAVIGRLEKFKKAAQDKK